MELTIIPLKSWRERKMFFYREHSQAFVNVWDLPYITSQTLLPPSQTMQACPSGHPRCQRKYESHRLAQNTNPSNSQIASTCQMICCFANFGNLMSLEARRYMQRPLAVQRPCENQEKHCAYSARSNGKIGLKSKKKKTIPIN